MTTPSHLYVHRAAISDSLSQKQHEAEELGLRWVAKLLADHRMWKLLPIIG